jgi:hypothetical protein
MSLVLIRGWLLIGVIAAMPLASLPLPFGPIQLPLTELILPIAAVSVVLTRVRGSAHAPGGLSRRETWAVALFLGAALLSLLVTEYPRQSLRELRLLIVEPVALYVLLRASALDSSWVPDEKPDHGFRHPAQPDNTSRQRVLRQPAHHAGQGSRHCAVRQRQEHHRHQHQVDGDRPARQHPRQRRLQGEGPDDREDDGRRLHLAASSAVAGRGGVSTTSTSSTAEKSTLGRTAIV